MVQIRKNSSKYITGVAENSVCATNIAGTPNTTCLKRIFTILATGGFFRRSHSRRNALCNVHHVVTCYFPTTNYTLSFNKYRQFSKREVVSCDGRNTAPYSSLKHTLVFWPAVNSYHQDLPHIRFLPTSNLKSSKLGPFNVQRSHPKNNI
jgi:hypothetical protein